VDNVVRRVLEADAPKSSIQGIRRFYDVVAAEPKVSVTAIQTVGAKGHDGLAIARVVADP
jgi:predicted O-methyltransferase YrrM